MTTNNEINKYIKDIKKQLLYGTKESKQFLKTLKQNITDYVEENRGADMVQVMEQFGNPKDIAATFFEQYGKEDIKKKINLRRGVVAAVVMFVLIIATTLVVNLVNSMNAKVAYYTDIIYDETTLSAEINSTDMQT